MRLLWNNLLPLSIVSTVAGIALIAIAEFGDVHEARVFGATLILLGGTGIGTHTGLADPRRLRVPGWLTRWRGAIGAIVTALVVAPPVIVLVRLIFGPNGGSGGILARVLGAAIGLAMLVATLLAAYLSISSITRAAGERPEEQGSKEHWESEGA
jgi:hypothetical protein